MQIKELYVGGQCEVIYNNGKNCCAQKSQCYFRVYDRNIILSIKHTITLSTQVTIINMHYIAAVYVSQPCDNNILFTTL